MMEMKKRYQVNFNTPEYDAVYEFHRHESGAFEYGNRSAVTLYRNGKVEDLIDTRYDPDVMKDFDVWCRCYLAEYFNPEYEPVITELADAGEDTQQMTAEQREAKKMEIIRNCPLKTLFDWWALTELMDIDHSVALVRGYIMDELERRDPDAFNQWIDSDDEAQLQDFFKEGT